MLSRRFEINDIHKIVGIFRIFELIIFGYLFIIIGNQLWSTDNSPVFFSFSVHNMSVGLIVLGMILSIAGVAKLAILITLPSEETRFSEEEIRILCETKFFEYEILERIYEINRKQGGMLLGGILLFIGFGFWDSEYDLSFGGMLIHDISAITVTAGGILVIFSCIQFLTYLIDIKLTTRDLKRANNKVSYGLVAYSSVEGEEAKILQTSPKKIPLSNETLSSISEKSVSHLLEKNKTKNIHTVFSFSIAREKCTVVTVRYNYTGKQASKRQKKNLILSFVIRPLWGNQEDLTTYLWNNQNRTTNFFDFFVNIRDLFNESTDKEMIQPVMDDFRTFSTLLLLTIKKKDLNAFTKA